MQGYPQQQQQYQQPPKKGLSGLAIVLIVLGVLAVLGLGTCVAGFFWVKGKAEDAISSMADGGLVLVSPPAVTSALAGPKKDYLGSWRSKKGTTLDITSDGNMRFEKDEDGDGVKEKLNAPIADFKGDDMEAKFGVVFTVHVSKPPHKVGDHYEMTADAIDLERK